MPTGLDCQGCPQYRAALPALAGNSDASCQMRRQPVVEAGIEQLAEAACAAGLPCQALLSWLERPKAPLP